jgi:hypothetical protein
MTYAVAPAGQWSLRIENWWAEEHWAERKAPPRSSYGGYSLTKLYCDRRQTSFLKFWIIGVVLLENNFWPWSSFPSSSFWINSLFLSLYNLSCQGKGLYRHRNMLIRVPMGLWWSKYNNVSHTWAISWHANDHFVYNSLAFVIVCNSIQFVNGLA